MAREIDVDAIDEAMKLSEQLAGLLVAIGCSSGAESFKTLTAKYQAGVLWLAQDLACQLREQIEKLGRSQE